MPRTKEKIVEKLVKYLKEDRPKKFKDCVKKYDVDLKRTVLSRQRTFLHCAAKHGSGLFIGYLLKQGVLVSQADSRGDLPVHVAIDRGLRLPPHQAAEVYRNLVIPLLKEYPESLSLCDRHGIDLCSRLAILNRHLWSADSDSSSSSESDSDDSDLSRCRSEEEEEDWGQRLARQFEDESADFYGRYDHYDDYDQETKKETFTDWSERMGTHMHRQRNQHHYATHHHPSSSGGQKRKHTTQPTSSKVPRNGAAAAAGIHNTKEAILKAKAAQNMDRLRRTYEERFQAALDAKGDNQMSFADLPWPSKASVEQAMEVLFGDKKDWGAAALRKFVRQQRVRWHPDKFLQKFVDKLAPKSFHKVMERVKEISQALNNKAQELSV